MNKSKILLLLVVLHCSQGCTTVNKNVIDSTPLEKVISGNDIKVKKKLYVKVDHFFKLTHCRFLGSCSVDRNAYNMSKRQKEENAKILNNFLLNEQKIFTVVQDKKDADIELKMTISHLFEQNRYSSIPSIIVYAGTLGASSVFTDKNELLDIEYTFWKNQSQQKSSGKSFLKSEILYGWLYFFTEEFNQGRKISEIDLMKNELSKILLKLNQI
ncbi:MAG: hypothetical protein V4612_06160 [Pseudomonadota bacterium]